MDSDLGNRIFISVMTLLLSVSVCITAAFPLWATVITVVIFWLLGLSMYNYLGTGKFLPFARGKTRS